LGVDGDKIGAKGSHTIVERLEELPKPSRKVQKITGTPEQEAQQIIQKMKEALAG
jgi:electron transfer flavoprotein alpha/beta subunit